MADPYTVVGGARTASDDDIRKAFRKHAKKHHPALNPGDKAAEAKFKEISQANDILSDPEKRRRFDAGEIDATGQEMPPRGFYRDQAGGFDGAKYERAGAHESFVDMGGIFSEMFGQRGGRNGGFSFRGGAGRPDPRPDRGRPGHAERAGGLQHRHVAAAERPRPARSQVEATRRSVRQAEDRAARQARLRVEGVPGEVGGGPRLRPAQGDGAVHMTNLDDLLRAHGRLTAVHVERWVERGLLRPSAEGEAWVFETVDVARARLLAALVDEIGFDGEAV